MKLGDGAVRIFINTKGKNRKDFSQEFLDFMKYITETTDAAAEDTESRKIKLIHEQVKRVRLSEQMGVKYMQRWEEMAYARQEGREEGREEGRQDGKVEGETIKLIKLICKKIEKDKKLEEIAEDLEEEIETIQPIYELAVKSAPEYDSEKIYKELY